MIIHQTQNSTIKLHENEQYVIKKQANARNEIRVLEFINHPRIVKLVQWEKNNKDYELVFPYYPRGDLFDAIYKERSHPPPLKIACELLEIAVHLHKCDVAHMDIKPENILLDNDGGILLIDFNLACFTSEYRGGIKGTAAYLPPEVLMKQDGRCPKKQDMWCIGLVLYEVLFKSVCINYKRIEKYKCPILKRIMLGCLDRDMETRMSACDMINAS
jgi:serine/threonine protein kinase